MSGGGSGSGGGGGGDDEQNPPPPPEIPKSLKAMHMLPAGITPLMYLQTRKAWSDAHARREQLSDYHRRALDELDELTDYEIDLDAITRMILTQVNGDAALQEQKIDVQYLRRDQRLKIPVGLAMRVVASDNDIHAGHADLRTRYLKIKGTPYHMLKAEVMKAGQRDALLTWVGTRPNSTEEQLAAEWSYLDAGNEPDDPAMVTYVFTELSIACQMNFDVRDFGAMYWEEMSLPDNAWMNLDIYSPTRLRSHLKSYTLTQIAGLNLGAVGGYELAAWMRAYALSFGVFPDRASKTKAEWVFVTSFAAQDRVDKVQAYESECVYQINQLCLSLLAMFGLFHLNKDHTFKSQDPNMDRIGKSWLNTIASQYGDAVYKELVDNQESVVRTAPHPFGLAQTYWLAKVMYQTNRLPPALRIRHDTTPPTVQRLMIARAAHKAWQAIPAGTVINATYRSKIDLIEEGYVAVTSNPVRYSSLYHLYGLDSQQQLEEEWVTAANSLMPIVYGFAEAVYVADDNTKTGFALALSLNNVKRDSSALATMWASMWTNHMDSMDTKDIGKFTLETYQQFYAAGAVGEIRI